MAEIRLTVDQKFIDDLKKETGVSKTTSLTNEALMLYKWIVSEVSKGRIILSADENGEHEVKIVAPILERTREKNKDKIQAAMQLEG